MSNHYVWAGGFLALAVGGIGYGSLKGLEASPTGGHASHESPPAPEAVKAAPEVSEAAPEVSKAAHGASKAAHRASGAAPETSVEARDALRRSMRAAIFLGRQGEFAAAAEALEALSRSHPEEASVWLNLGIARLGTRDLDGAESAFMRTIEIAPEDWDAHAELANVALDRGDVSTALARVAKIPVGGGRMQDRLRHGRRWHLHLADPRVGALRARHGLDATPARSERMQRELESRRTAAESSPSSSPDGDAATGETSPPPSSSSPPEASLAPGEPPPSASGGSTAPGGPPPSSAAGGASSSALETSSSTSGASAATYPSAVPAGDRDRLGATPSPQ